MNTCVQGDTHERPTLIFFEPAVVARLGGNPGLTEETFDVIISC